MPQFIAAGFIVAHGLITTMIGAGGVTNPASPALTMPAWLAWWPGPFGRSWLFDALHLGSGAPVMGGLLWLAAGLALMAAGLGWLGVPMLSNEWETLAFWGAVLGLVALALYFHPFYLVAIVIDLAIVLVLAHVLAPAH